MRGLVIAALVGFMATSIYAQIQITPEVGTSIYKCIFRSIPVHIPVAYKA